MFFWNSLAFSMIQRILAIWSLVLLPFLNPAWTSGSSRFTQGCHRLEQKSVWESMWEHTVSTWTDHVTYGCNSIVLVFDSPNNLFFFFFAEFLCLTTRWHLIFINTQDTSLTFQTGKPHLSQLLDSRYQNFFKWQHFQRILYSCGFL